MILYIILVNIALFIALWMIINYVYRTKTEIEQCNRFCTGVTIICSAKPLIIAIITYMWCNRCGIFKIHDITAGFNIFGAMAGILIVIFAFVISAVINGIVIAVVWIWYHKKVKHFDNIKKYYKGNKYQ